MTAGSQRAALDAISSARPIIARLSMARDSEDLAADLIEAWTATETGLRSLIGGSALTGQMLIRELRQRHFLSLEQANALAELADEHLPRQRGPADQRAQPRLGRGPRLDQVCGEVLAVARHAEPRDDRSRRADRLQRGPLRAGRHRTMRSIPASALPRTNSSASWVGTRTPVSR